MNHIHRTTNIEAQISDVWSFLTEPEKIEKWLMSNTFEAKIGHAFTMDCPPGVGSGAPIDCVIKELSPPQSGKARLVYTWVIDEPHTETLLEIDLIEIGGTTNVDLIHSGWASADDELRGRHAMGWTHLLGQLLPDALREFGQ